MNEIGCRFARAENEFKQSAALALSAGFRLRRIEIPLRDGCTTSLRTAVVGYGSPPDRVPPFDRMMFAARRS